MTNETSWSESSPFQSVTYTQHFLKECYERGQVRDALAKSYKNSYPMSYYLDYGQRYYEQASMAPTLIKPVLLFYGMVQLIKACLLTVHPDYPENSDVLAHGVSARKRKKQDYSFFDDTVTTQKKGLFSLLSEKIHVLNGLEGQKFNMESLLIRIPELRNLFSKIKGKTVSLPVNLKENKFEVSVTILDHLHMTENRLESYLNQHSKYSFELQKKEGTDLSFTLNKRVDKFNAHPFQWDDQGQLFLPLTREGYKELPELLVHYLLLYNLSMISRYETEWWNDLFHQKTSYDLPFITEFLSITEKKVPQLIFIYLQRKESEIMNNQQ